jgi:hypothetical protein
MDIHDNGQPTQEDDIKTRRKFLRTLGFAGVLAAGAAQMVPAVAQPRAPDLRIELSPNINMDAKLATLNRTALAQLKLSKRMSPAVSIEQMGLTPEGVAELTPAAKTLTKLDLVQLGNGRLTEATKGLTVKDIGSIRKAFGTNYAPGKIGGAALDVSCCCCTPCCCAVAVNAPLMLQAA